MNPEIQYLTILSGLPGSGKTNWTRRTCEMSPGTYAVSGDDFRTMFNAGRYVFDERIETLVEKSVITIAAAALIYSLDVVVDECLLTLTAADRRSIITRLKSDAERRSCKKLQTVLVNFVPHHNALLRRIADPRGLDPEQWRSVYLQLEAQYQPPSEKEPFDVIINLTEENYHEYFK